jgi:proline-specific peptidase
MTDVHEYGPATEQRLSLVPELGDTWCRVVGERTSRPALVLLHGGPGYNCEYLRRFEVFAGAGRRVVRYDQIGGGRSTVADHHYVPDRFTVDVFRRELAALRAALGLDEVVLVGQSWGCMLALEHVLAGAEGVRALVLMSGLASIEEWNAETLRLRSELPPEVLAVLRARADDADTVAETLLEILQGATRAGNERLWPRAAARRTQGVVVARLLQGREDGWRGRATRGGQRRGRRGGRRRRCR